MFVRVLRHWNGIHPGIFVDVRGASLKEGVADGSLDDQAKIEHVPDAEKHPAVIGADEALKPAKASKAK